MLTLTLPATNPDPLANKEGFGIRPRLCLSSQSHRSGDSLARSFDPKCSCRLQIADHLSFLAILLIFGDLPGLVPPISNRDLLIPPPPPSARLHSKAPSLHDKRPYIHPRVDCSNIIQHRACQGEVASASIGPGCHARRRRGQEGVYTAHVHIITAAARGNNAQLRGFVITLHCVI